MSWKYVIRLAATGFGRHRGTYYFFKEAEPYTQDIALAWRFNTREEAETYIDDQGNAIDEDEPSVVRVSSKLVYS